MENLEMGAFLQDDKGQIDCDMRSVFERFPRLKERQNQPGGTPFRRRAANAGYRARVDVAPQTDAAGRALYGLGTCTGRTDLRDHRENNKQGTSILLVNRTPDGFIHRRPRLRSRTGNIVLQGSAKKVMDNPSVIQAYLGG